MLEKKQRLDDIGDFTTGKLIYITNGLSECWTE